MKRFGMIVIACLTLTCACTAFATILYVDDDAPPGIEY